MTKGFAFDLQYNEMPSLRLTIDDIIIFFSHVN